MEPEYVRSTGKELGKPALGSEAVQSTKRFSPKPGGLYWVLQDAVFGSLLSIVYLIQEK